MITRIKKIALIGMFFLFSKSTVFFAPLLLSNALPAADYGLFESCLAYGSLLAAILGAGLYGAVPYFLLIRKERGFLNLIYGHAALLFVLGGVGQILSGYGVVPISINLGIAIALIMNWQRVFSAEMKCVAQPSLSSLSDSLLFVVLVMIVVFAQQNLTLERLAEHFSVFFWAMTFVAIFWVLRLYPLKVEQRTYVSELYAFALPTILPGMLLLMITTLVRLIAPMLVSPEELANYSFYFRLASVSVVAYQFLATVFFAQLYQREPEQLDTAYVRVAMLMVLLGVVGFFVFPKLLVGYFKLLAGYHQYYLVYFILVFFCSFWVCQAMLESIVYRTKQSGVFLRAQVLGLIMFGVALVGLYATTGGKVTIVQIAFLHTLLMALVVLQQLSFLKVCGFNFPKLRKFNMLMVAVMSSGFFVLGGAL